MSAAQPIMIGLLAGLVIASPIAWLALRKAVERARAAERRARDAQRMAEIGAMTGGLAHEIKNPLSTIGLNAQLAAEAVAELPVEATERDRLVRRIASLRREVDRLRDILESFLRFAGELRLDASPADVNELVDELADFYLPQAQSSGVQLRVDLCSEPIVACVDKTHLKQALLNLMINATQAMAGDRESDAAARELILKTERVRDDAGPACRIHVIDTGPGISAEQLERLFTPYYTTRSGGSGLGLPISRRIIEEHHGRIEARSDVGKGADLAITLPMCD